MQTLEKRGKTRILVSHDEALAASVTTSTWTVADGEVHVSCSRRLRTQKEELSRKTAPLHAHGAAYFPPAFFFASARAAFAALSFGLRSLAVL